jgi:hypothetical protein
VTEVVCGRPLRRKVKTAEDKTACGNTRRNEGNERQMKTAKCEMSCGKMKRGIRIVTGGAFQGKKNYAQLCYPGLKWSSGADCSFEDVKTWEAVDGFHLFIWRWLKSGRTKEELLEMISEERDLVIVCDEIGCGLVPVDAFEREYREAVGRIMTGLTKKAVRADRVICGIGYVIK